jgi:hypothetical protein
MATDQQRNGEAAQRALQDVEFAKAVLEGRENYPEVRQAIMEDLATSDNDEVKGFALNPSTTSSLSSARALDTYIQGGPKPGGMHLVELINKAGIRARPDPW